MALTHASRGTGSRNTAAENTYVITPASNFTRFSLAVLTVAYDNSGASGADPFSDVQDSKGNPWATIRRTLNDPVGASAGVVLATLVGLMRNPLTTSDTITVSFGGITTVARAYTLDEVASDVWGRIPFLVGHEGATGASTTPSIASASMSTGDLVVGAMGAEHNSAITADSDTSNGSWSAAQTSGIGSTTSGVEVMSQRKLVTGTGAQTYNTVITSADWAANTLRIREAATPANVGCYLNVDFSDTASITSSGGNITAINDKSGNARHLTNVAGTPKTGTRSFNGRNVGDFQGAASLWGANLTHAALITIIAIGKFDAITSPPSLDPFMWAFGATGPAIFPDDSTGNWQYYQGGTNVDSGDTADTGVHRWRLLGGAGAFSNLVMDNVAIASGDAGAGAPSGEPFVIGDYGGGGHALDGWVGEIVLVTGSAPDLANVILETMLDIKWGMVTAAQSATVTFVANDAHGNVSASAESATVAFVANDATTTSTGGTFAPAEQAALTFVANDATTQVAPSVGTATVAFVANDATTQVAPSVGTATVAFVANDATTQVAPSVGTATVAFVAENASVVTGAIAAAEAPAIAFVANDATTMVAPSVGTATVAFVANDATVATAVVGVAGQPSIAFVANDATVIFARFAPAEQPAVSFVANNATTKVAPSVGTAIISFVADDAAVFVPEPPPFVQVYIYGPPPSARWAGRVAETHEVITRAHVFRLDVPDPIAEYAVLDGSVTIASRDEVHRSGELVIGPDLAGREIAPDEAGDIFGPTRCEIQIWQGVRYANTDIELMAVARMKVEEYEMTPASDGRQHRLQLFDRSIRVRQKFGEVFSISPGTPVEAAVERIIHHKCPTIPVDLPQTGDTTPLLAYAPGDDCWQKAQGLMRSCGYELTCSVLGVITATRVVLMPAEQPDWTLIEDGRDVAYDVGRSLKGGDVPNHVVVTSGRSGSEIRGEAFDNDPDSPTWIHGEHGDVLFELTDANVTTTDQANRAAGLILARKAGIAETNSASVLPNPAMQADHTVRAVRPSIGLDARMLIDQIDLSLKSGPAMSVAFRRGVKTDHELLSA